MKKKKKKVPAKELEIQFRERRFKDLKPVRHPKPIPGYQATLPGPPGWQYKIDPGP